MVNGGLLVKTIKTFRKKEGMCAYSYLDQLSVKLKNTVFHKVFWNICQREILSSRQLHLFRWCDTNSVKDPVSRKSLRFGPRFGTNQTLRVELLCQNQRKSEILIFHSAHKILMPPAVSQPWSIKK